jgi:hypothetical protein
MEQEGTLSEMQKESAVPKLTSNQRKREPMSTKRIPSREHEPQAYMDYLEEKIRGLEFDLTQSYKENERISRMKPGERQ